MKVEILGVKIDRIFKKEALEKIREFLESGESHQIVTVNPEFIMTAQYDLEFRNILNQSTLSLPDGVGLILASWYLKKPLRERITGTDLVYEIAKIASENQKSIYFLGAGDDIAKKCALNLKKLYPSLLIRGVESGFRFHWWRLSEETLRKKINRSHAEILLVAYGAPKQEKWIYHNLPYFKNIRLAIGVGGAFDYISGQVKRAPETWRKLGLEWFWRLLSQPWRLNRIITATLKFPQAILKEKNNEKS